MSCLYDNGYGHSQEKQIGEFPIARVCAFLLLLFISALNLFIYYGAVKTVITEGIHYREFESWNFIFELFYVPFAAILYLIAILFIAYALKKDKKYKQTLLLPVYFVFLKPFLLFFFSYGLAEAEKFNYALLRDFTIDCIIFLLAIAGLLFHLYKIREFDPHVFQYSRKRGLLTLNLHGAVEIPPKRTD